MLSATAVLAVALFVAINPYLYTEGLARLVAMPAVVGDWMVKQQIRPGGGLFSLREKVTAVGWMTLESPGLPLVRAAGRAGGVLMALCTLLGLSSLIRTAITEPSAGDRSQVEQQQDTSYKLEAATECDRNRRRSPGS